MLFGDAFCLLVSVFAEFSHSMLHVMSAEIQVMMIKCGDLFYYCCQLLIILLGQKGRMLSLSFKTF